MRERQREREVSRADRVEGREREGKSQCRLSEHSPSGFVYKLPIDLWRTVVPNALALAQTRFGLSRRAFRPASGAFNHSIIRPFDQFSANQLNHFYGQKRNVEFCQLHLVNSLYLPPSLSRPLSLTLLLSIYVFTFVSLIDSLLESMCLLDISLYRNNRSLNVNFSLPTKKKQQQQQQQQRT